MNGAKVKDSQCSFKHILVTSWVWKLQVVLSTNLCSWIFMVLSLYLLSPRSVGLAYLFTEASLLCMLKKKKILQLHHQKCITWNCVYALKMKETYIYLTLLNIVTTDSNLNGTLEIESLTFSTYKLNNS